MDDKKAENWAKVADKLSHVEAHTMKGYLETNDIAVQLQGEHFTSVSPHLADYAGIALLVQYRDLDRARLLLKEIEKGTAC